MKTRYQLSVGSRKALWALVYLAAAAVVDTILKHVSDIPGAADWVAYPIVIALLTLLGNWLKFRRTQPA